MFEGISDNDLIKSVKERADSQSVCELINRHSGIYATVGNKYLATGSPLRNEYDEDKFYNMYRAVLAYDPDKNTKFSTFLYQGLTFGCWNGIRKNDAHFPKSGKTLLDFADAPVVTAANVTDDFRDEVERREFIEEKNALIKNKLDKAKDLVSTRDRMIFLAELKNNNFSETGKELGVSRQTVSHVYKLTLEKIQLQHYVRRKTKVRRGDVEE